LPRLHGGSNDACASRCVVLGVIWKTAMNRTKECTSRDNASGSGGAYRDRDRFPDPTSHDFVQTPVCRFAFRPWRSRVCECAL